MDIEHDAERTQERVTLLMQRQRQSPSYVLNAGPVPVRIQWKIAFLPHSFKVRSR